MKEESEENPVVRGMLQGRNQSDIAIEDDGEGVTETGAPIHSILLEQVHSRFLHDDELTSVPVGHE